MLFIKGGGCDCERTPKMLQEHRAGARKRAEEVSGGNDVPNEVCRRNQPEGGILQAERIGSA